MNSPWEGSLKSYGLLINSRVSPFLMGPNWWPFLRMTALFEDILSFVMLAAAFSRSEEMD